MLGDRLTTVFVRQGHYASDAEADAAANPPDIRLDRIGDLAGLSAVELQIEKTG